MKWLNEEYEEYEKNSYYSAECSDCRCIATFIGSISQYYEYCPFCGKPAEKEVKNDDGKSL